MRAARSSRAHEISPREIRRGATGLPEYLLYPDLRARARWWNALRRFPARTSFFSFLRVVPFVRFAYAPVTANVVLRSLFSSSPAGKIASCYDTSVKALYQRKIGKIVAVERKGGKG